ncbi:vesicle coat component [Apophysomyces sp. BC1021]|nr:vesicle coat component [Apophysomyces sp. BC1021]
MAGHSLPYVESNVVHIMTPPVDPVGATTYQGQADPADPLFQLNRAREYPVATFGFGGKLCLTFPRRVQRYTTTGKCVIWTKRMPGAVKISLLKDVLGEKDPMIASLSGFVGPVLLDAQVGTKQKTKEILAYMERRIEEFANDENLSLLWKLVKVLVEQHAQIKNGNRVNETILDLIRIFPSGKTSQARLDGLDKESEIETRSEMVLDEIQQCLAKGDRAGAVEYAIQESLWEHALIIGSCVDKALWSKVVAMFVRQELNTPSGQRSDHLPAKDRQALRVLYALFAGSGAHSMHHFLSHPKRNIFSRTSLSLQSTKTEEELGKWREMLTLILANQTTQHDEAIAALGDILRSHGWIHTAHICYILSPLSSLHSGVDDPRARMTLLGVDTPATNVPLDAYYLSELFEFAYFHMQPTRTPLAFLQGYKLIHAWRLAEVGFVDEARRYCDAITHAVKFADKDSVYIHSHFLYALGELSQRCGIAGAKDHSLRFVSGEDLQLDEPGLRKSTEIISGTCDIKSPARNASTVDIIMPAKMSIGPEENRYGAATPTTWNGYERSVYTAQSHQNNLVGSGQKQSTSKTR